MNFSLEGRVLSAQWQEPLADDHSDRNPHATNTGLAAHDTGTEGLVPVPTREELAGLARGAKRADYRDRTDRV
jgi:hypothetical protein